MRAKLVQKMQTKPSYTTHYVNISLQEDVIYSAVYYLPSYCTVSRIYEAYKKIWVDSTAVSRHVYESYFDELNLVIKHPKRTLALLVTNLK